MVLFLDHLHTLGQTLVVGLEIIVSILKVGDVTAFFVPRFLSGGTVAQDSRDRGGI